MKYIPIVFFLALICGLQPQAVSEPLAIRQYGDWIVFTENTGGENLCYAITQATDKAPKSVTHGDVWFYVSNWKSGKARNQPSLKLAYELRSDLQAKAIIGRDSWPLFASANEAFASDEDDSELVDKLKRGRELRIEATSSRNTRVFYHFSLSGSASAIRHAARLCN